MQSRSLQLLKVPAVSLLSLNNCAQKTADKGLVLFFIFPSSELLLAVPSHLCNKVVSGIFFSSQVSKSFIPLYSTVLIHSIIINTDCKF